MMQQLMPLLQPVTTCFTYSPFSDLTLASCDNMRRRTNRIMLKLEPQHKIKRIKKEKIKRKKLNKGSALTTQGILSINWSTEDTGKQFVSRPPCLSPAWSPFLSMCQTDPKIIKSNTKTQSLQHSWPDM